MPRPSPLLPFLAALLLLNHACTRTPSPEHQQADRLLAAARESFNGGRLRESRALLADAHALDSRLGRIPQLASELEMLAEIAAAGGALDSAFALYDGAALHYRSLGDRGGTVRMSLLTAALHRAGGANEKAFGILTEALRIARLFRDSMAARTLLSALVPAARDLERNAEDVYLAEFLEDARSRADAGALARGHLEAGRSAVARADTAREVEELLRAMTFAAQAGDSLLGISILAELADAYARQGLISESFATYTTALTRCDVVRGAERLRIAMLARVGNIYVRAGTPAEAVRFYRAALDGSMAVRDRLMEGYLFVQLGHCDLAAGAADAAEQKYRSAMDLFEGVRHPRGAAYALTSLGALAEARRQFVEALEFYRRALLQEEGVHTRREAEDVTLDCERARPSSVPASGEEGAVSLLLQTGRADEAFRIVDARIARARAAALRRVGLRTGDAGMDTLLTALRSASERQSALEVLHTSLIEGRTGAPDLLPEVLVHIADADRRLAMIEQMIRETLPVVSPALRREGLSAAEVQSLVPPGSALLMPVPTERSLYLLSLSAAGLAVDLSATPRDRIIEQTRLLRSALVRRALLEDSSEALRLPADRLIADLAGLLFTAVVRPVERHLTMPGPLYVVLPEELDGLPVHILGRAAGGAVRHPVEEQVAVHYLPSAGALRVDRRPPRSRYQFVALGHPGATGWDVEYELRDIRAFDKDVRLYFGRKAVPDSLRASRGDVVHLALDLRYGVRFPENARVLFSDGITGDGTRAAAWGEFLTLPTASLVVVSDLAAHMPGKNAALAQLFLMTRTPAVVLHSISPHRRSRKIFGEHLYTALLAGAAPDAAFHKAMLAMRKTAGASGAHHWGAFEFWGK